MSILGGENQQNLSHPCQKAHANKTSVRSPPAANCRHSLSLWVTDTPATRVTGDPTPPSRQMSFQLSHQHRAGWSNCILILFIGHMHQDTRSVRGRLPTLCIEKHVHWYNQKLTTESDNIAVSSPLIWGELY